VAQLGRALGSGPRGRQFESVRPDIFDMYIYILKSKLDGSYYVGLTKNIEERISYHNKGYNLSTKAKIPWELIKIEEFKDTSLAIKRERFLKTGRGRSIIKAQFG
jgi:putative endonuclease